jgi:hypothetical protein
MSNSLPGPTFPGGDLAPPVPLVVNIPMSVTARIRHWWQETTGTDELPLDRDSGAWLVSLGVHLAILIALATAYFWLPRKDSLQLAALPLEVDEELQPEEFQFDEEFHLEIGALSTAGTANAEAAAPEVAETSEVLIDLPESFLEADVPAVDVDVEVIHAPEFSKNQIVKGTGYVGTTGAAGAIDRLTNEILLSLEQRPTLVVWLFDQSGSLKAQRQEIVKRFDRVYEELGVVEAAGKEAFKKHADKPLLTAVASFGKSVNMLTPEPTDSLPDIKDAVRAVRDDKSGEENVFAAVAHLANQFRMYRLKAPPRNVMFVVFTDECGNDYQNVDTAVNVCRKFAMPVYVVGVPAPFGRKEGLVKYVDPDPEYDQTPRFVPVDQGPESLMPERIKLRFFGQNDRDDPIESGFGPFALMRLTVETGGIFFAVHPNRRTQGSVNRDETDEMAPHFEHFFDPLVMRNYRPDYVPLDVYRKGLAQNGAKAALVQAATQSWTEQMDNIRLTFPKVDEGRLAQDLSMAQREAAKLEPKIGQLVAILKQGERDRPKITEPRWRAGYDLAMGRALASKVRTEGYNAMLAVAKQGMKFKDPKNDTWVLKPSPQITTGSATEREATDAVMYLERVVEEHPGTPWALLAEKELSTPLGWEWTEQFTNVAGRMQIQGNGGNPRPPMENVPPRKVLRPVPPL